MRDRDLKNMSRKYYIHLIIVPEREKRIVGREELISQHSKRKDPETNEKKKVKTNLGKISKLQG